MSHYMLFKQNVDPGEQSAAAKERDKTLRALAKERQKILDEERAAHDKEVKQKKRTAANQRSASMVGPGCFSADGGGGGAGGAADRDSSSPSPSPPAPDSALLQDLRKNWTSALKVVFKDLPRLAKRTAVQTEAHGVVVEAGRIIRSLHGRPATAVGGAASAGSASASPPATAAAASSSSPSPSAIPTGLNVRAASISFSRGTAPNDPSPSPSSASSYTPLANPAPGTSPLPNRRGTTGGEGWKGTMVVRQHNKKVWQEKWESNTNKDGAGTGAESPAVVPLPMSPGATAAAASSGVSPKSPLSVVSPTSASKHHAGAPSQGDLLKQPQPASSPSAKSAATVALPSSPSNAAASSSVSTAAKDEKFGSLARSQNRSQSVMVGPSAGAGAAGSAAASASAGPSAAAASAGPSAGGLSAPFQDLSLSSGEVDTWQAVCNVVLTCVELLEPTETLAAARSAFALAASSMSAGSDHQGLLEDIFTKSIGTHTKTFRIFQAIHQSILFPAIAFLHENLYSKMQTPNMKVGGAG